MSKVQMFAHVLTLIDWKTIWNNIDHPQMNLPASQAIPVLPNTEIYLVIIII